MQAYDAYEPCGSCHRHVKRQDATCPFCGAARTPVRPASPVRIQNVSRARWLAFGSTLVGMGCTGVVASSGGSAGHGPQQDGSMAMTAPTATASGDDSSGEDATSADDVSTGGDDAAPEASGSSSGGADGWGAPNASCPRSGNFTCGTDACDRGSEFCLGTVGGGGGCQPLLALPMVLVDSGTCASCPTCDCIPPSQYGGTCTCFMDNYGGLTVACSQGGCYGSPPARLERAPLRAIG